MAAKLSDEQRRLEEKDLRELAGELKHLAAQPAIESHLESIQGFAAQAEEYADKIRDAATPEEAAELVKEVEGKKTQWCELMEMLALAAEMSDPDGEALKEAENRLRKAATDLKEVSQRGTSAAFTVIARVASEAEASLKAFLEATEVQEKWNIFARFEENRARWLGQMETLRSGQQDGNASEAATDVPGDIFCDAVSEAGSEEFCKAADAFENCMNMPFDMPFETIDGFGGYDGFGGGAACVAIPGASGYSSAAACATTESSASAAPAEPAGPKSTAAVEANLAAAQATPMSPDEAREQIKKLLQDEEEGLLVTLRKTVAKVKEDDRFEQVHEDATKLLEQMELAAGAICPEALQQEFADSLEGAEDKLKATVEPMRKAQWGAFYSKKHASALKKFDLYHRRGGKLPKLSEDHGELLECVQVVLQLAEYLRKEAQNALMDSVTGLVAQTMIRR